MGAWDGSFSPISKQLMQFDSFRTGGCHRHVHGQGHGCDRITRRNCSRNIEGDHTAAEFTHAILAGEEVKTSAVAVVALSRIGPYRVLSLVGVMLMMFAVAVVAPAKPSAHMSDIASRVLEAIIGCVEDRS